MGIPKTTFNYHFGSLIAGRKKKRKRRTVRRRERVGRKEVDRD